MLLPLQIYCHASSIAAELRSNGTEFHMIWQVYADNPGLDHRNQKWQKKKKRIVNTSIERHW